MGARQGQNNFQDHQRKAAEQGGLRIRRALKALPRGTRYADVNALIRVVAAAAGIHATTLRRNKTYLRLVWDHVTANPAIVTQPVDDTAPRAKLMVQAIAADIEAAALRRENDRLKLLVERLTAQPLAPTGAGARAVAGPDGSEAAFERTATVLARVLARFTAKELGIVLDLRRGEILDEAETGDERVIAGRPDTTPFLEWMRRQRGEPKPAAQE